MTAHVVGLDLSLTATGLAHVTTILRTPETLTVKSKGVPRLVDLRDMVLRRIDGVQPDLVVVEGYAHGRTNRAHQLGELGGVVRVALTEAGHRWTELPPASVKKYATGKGNAGKELMLVEAVKRLGYAGSSNDEADALWLACAGHHLLGHPVVDVPKTHAVALDGFTLEVPA